MESENIQKAIKKAYRIQSMFIQSFSRDYSGTEVFKYIVGSCDEIIEFLEEKS